METSSMRPRRVSWRLAALLSAAFALGLAACSGAAAPILSKVGGAVSSGDQYTGSGAGPAQPAASAAASGAELGSTNGASGGGSGSNTGQGTIPNNDVSRPDLLIIKTGTMTLQVVGIDDALSAASAKITNLGGYSAGSQRSGDGDQAQASVTYRIPSAQWDTALAAIRALASKVISEESQTQDVTGQVVDLGARITNLQATEKALQAIMSRATKISDVLAVQSQLTDVRGQIEELSTQKTHLEGQASFSTLTVTFSLKPPPAVTTTAKDFDPAGEVDRATASMVGILQALAAAGIWFGIVWLPILITLAVLFLIGWVITRRLRRSGGGPGTIEPIAQG